MWQIDYYSARVEQQLLAMPDGLLARYLRLLDMMEDLGRTWECHTPGQWAVDC